jgi:TFIIF-interacting CTD phosphatase-like protein
VLDLDETLIYTLKDTEMGKYDLLVSVKIDQDRLIQHIKVNLRPGLDKFLSELS